MLLTVEDLWGICAPPPASLKPRPAFWDPFIGGGARDRGLVPDILPADGSPEWLRLRRQIADKFVMAMERRLKPPPRISRIQVCHPAEEGMIEQLRAVYNDEVEPVYSDDGRAQPLPRVWRWECEFVPFWIWEG